MGGDLCDSPPERLRTQPQRTAVFQQSLPTDWRSDVRSVRIPTVIVHGARDAIPVAASRAWSAALPNARLVVIPAADHLPWVEQPEQFFPVVDRFLRDGKTASER